MVPKFFDKTWYGCFFDFAAFFLKHEIRNPMLQKLHIFVATNMSGILESTDKK